MDKPRQNAVNQRIRARVLHAIAANRTPGYHFIGHFFNFERPKVSGGIARLVCPLDPHCWAASGEIDLVVLGILIDCSLSAAVRMELPSGTRLGTLHLQAQFTGVPAVGDLEADSLLLGPSKGAALQQSLASATIRVKNEPYCYVSGAYAPLKAPPGVTLCPLPWEMKPAPPVVPADPGQLDSQELAILKACDAALRKASPEASFIQCLWGGKPRRTAYGASNRVPIRPQIANRVGHVHGGILFGLAAANACAAAPQSMMLWNLSAFFISPGCGKNLAIKSRLLHAGRTIAVVRTEIRNADGKIVLEATSNHVARKTN